MSGIELHSSTLLTLDGVAYRLAVQPAAPGLPVVRQGSQSLVYQLLSDSGSRALKVFGPRFRQPPSPALARQLESLVDLPGLRACHRTVLTPDRHAVLLRTSPELSCAVLMPWIDGPTWEEVVLHREPLGPTNTLWLARGLARALSALEQRRAAHCEIAGANVLLPGLAPGGAAAEAHPAALVDLEGLCAPGLERPASLPPVSDGYAHPAAGWGPAADRFAGAVMLGEMLGWSDSRVRESACGPSFFEPGELRRDGRRFRLLYWVLRELWGTDLAQLFQRAWYADSTQACPAFAEWLPLLLDLRGPAASNPALVEVPIAVPPAVHAHRHAPGRRTVARVGLAGLCATACVAAAQVSGVLAPAPARPPQRAVESTPVAAVPPPATPAAARPLAARPTVSASPTPAVEDAWDAALVLLDLAWGQDWATTVDVLDRFIDRYPDYQPPRDKLYQALVEYAKSLIGTGKPGQAMAALSRARTLAPDRAEAAQVLASLTPTPIPTSTPPPPTPTPLPAPPPDTLAVVPAPVEAVRSFYQLVQQGPSARAADLWTPRLRALFPPAENITGRFSHTRAVIVERADLVALDQTAGRATVAVILREQLDSPPLERHYRGTWDLVRSPTGWLLDQPDLRLN